MVRKPIQRAIKLAYLRFILKIFGLVKNLERKRRKIFSKNKMKHDLTIRAQVVALKNAGHSQHEAAGVIGKPLSFVKR